MLFLPVLRLLELQPDSLVRSPPPILQRLHQLLQPQRYPPAAPGTLGRGRSISISINPYIQQRVSQKQAEEGYKSIFNAFLAKMTISSPPPLLPPRPAVLLLSSGGPQSSAAVGVSAEERCCWLKPAETSPEDLESKHKDTTTKVTERLQKNSYDII